MDTSTTPSAPQRPHFKRPVYIPPVKGNIGKWYLPTMGMIALGFGVYNYYNAPTPAYDPEEAERLRRNKALMDAYGDKETLQDIERAFALYEIQ
ncbi:hypothetical protein F9C07_10939 [Aspergillus flavus]|uniref:Uncharacterized protein n=3 Tax=Aspergillus subgen. Circumdati TaxID=2720871 RepID=B8NRP2_ASPFN|nr:uncharacterized protein G4B84_000461 [Aspergillus flavus NRRL3357]KAB8243968.1 hypothetical protein BDV35DRAFT_395368 [Aspergillus flavus]KAB8274969.1 hypothetical protein BDV30DRAFT_236994 [Aspergillus minisclerotigenes]KOC12440.1 hypothetical protein AFLA70_40g004361 [Aspergillus flavus AF70]KAF7630193.1 hypothetical protein AFLA_010821 [Aspergillus flavus NRRL3357]KAJ1714058.1 hypothetical protein NYO67_3801 [Aspergillus flavus]